MNDCLLTRLRRRVPAAPANPLAPKPPHFAGKAKHVIYMHMAGSPSQLDLFDYKPKLNELNGQPCPESLFKKERFAFIKGVPKDARHAAQVCQARPVRRGGVEPAAAPGDGRRRHRHRRSRWCTDQFNHAPAQLFLNTGSAQLGRPSMGSWLTYGLGSENQNLPGFVVLISAAQGPDGGTSLWGSGFLPSVYQGVQFRSQGDPVLYVSNPRGHGRAAAPPLARRASRSSTSCSYARSAIPRRSRASSSTRWPTACRRACRR